MYRAAAALERLSGPDHAGSREHAMAEKRIGGKRRGFSPPPWRPPFAVDWKAFGVDLRKLAIGELAQLLNSTPAGPVTTEPALRRHRTLAGFKIGDGKRFDLVRYLAWLFWEVHRPASGAGYEAIKERARARAAKISVSGREIGELPKVKNSRRRFACRRNFRLYCESYFPETFYLPWSADHLRAIAKIERSVLEGGLFAWAMPRGGGKTSLCERAALWAESYGWRHFVVIVGSEATAALEMLQTIKREIETNPRLAEDFPEICYPIARLGGIAQRAAGQLYQGKPTYPCWESDMIVLPSIPGKASSGAIVKTTGITGRILGMKHQRADGRSDRPDLIIPDDPQTPESAHSRTQTADRLRIINRAVLGLAGPGKRIAGFLPCTVIERDDLSDQVLDRDRYPEWQGERMKLAYALPTNGKLWAEYEKILVEDVREERGMARATAFYRDRQAAMDEGARVPWTARFDKGEISAVQNAMNLKILRPAFFAAEMQGEPLAPQGGGVRVSAEEVCQRVSGLPAGRVPPEATVITAGADVHDEILYWVVCAWEPDFTGQVMQYGTFPEQPERWFSQASPPRPLSALFPGQDKDGVIQSGLEQLCGVLLKHEFEKHAGGAVTAMSVEQLLVDSGYKPTLVYNVRRKLASPVMQASKGMALRATNKPIAAYQRKPGWKMGDDWYVPSVRGTREYPHVCIDTNAWKSRVHRALSAAPGTRGALTLFGALKTAAEHEAFAEQVANSEYFVEVFARGRVVNEYKIMPHRPDNHWWDCLVLCAVGASMRGCRPPAEAQGAAKPSGGPGGGYGKRLRKSLAEMAKAS
jgi:hypothetical protein